MKLEIIVKLEKEKNDLLKEIENLKKVVDQRDQTIEVKTSSINSLEAKKKELEDIIADLRKQLENLWEEIEIELWDQIEAEFEAWFAEEHKDEIEVVDEEPVSEPVEVEDLASRMRNALLNKVKSDDTEETFGPKIECIKAVEEG